MTTGRVIHIKAGGTKFEYGSKPEIKEGREEMFYLMMHSKHFNSYMASDIW